MSSKQYAPCLIKHLSDTQSPMNTCVYTFLLLGVLPDVWSLFLHLVFSEWCKNTRNVKHSWCKDCDAEWRSALNMLFWLLILLKRFHGLETSLFKSDGFTAKTLQFRETVWAFSLCLCWGSPWITVIMAIWTFTHPSRTGLRWPTYFTNYGFPVTRENMCWP